MKERIKYCLKNVLYGALLIVFAAIGVTIFFTIHPIVWILTGFNVDKWYVKNVLDVLADYTT